MNKTTSTTPQSKIPTPPKGLETLKWFGPGLLWMVSAAGSGELLFSPRIGSLYGYTLVWALLATVLLKWFINREIGRYTVCTGKSILDGFKTLGGRSQWSLYLILIPQLFVAVATIAGLAGSSATALILAFPGDLRLWAVGAILTSTALVVWGKFKGVELVASILASLLALASIIAAILVFSDYEAFIRGYVPRIAPEVSYGEILPWLGFMLSGAAGMIWYSYWVQEKGYGRAGLSPEERQKDPSYTEEDKKKLKGWLGHMTMDNNIAVIGTLIITIAFLILGVEILKPAGLIPQESNVARVLGQLLGKLWGPVGYWFMVIGVFIGFWSTVLSDQDGFGRMFAGGFRHLLKPLDIPEKWMQPQFLNRFFVLTVVTALPIALYLAMGEPVNLLKLAGFIEAAHIPVLTALVLLLNHRELPKELQPSWLTTGMTALAGLFFGVFAIIYLLQLTGILTLE